MGQAKATANQTAVAEQFTDLIRRGIGRHVKIFWFFAQQQIAYAAANQPGFVASFIQAVHHLEGVFTDIFAGNSVLLAWDDGDRGLADGLVNLAFLAI